MEKLTVEYIIALERAAMAELTDSERKIFAVRVEKLLAGELMQSSLDDKLNSLEPMLQPLPIRNVMRDDVQKHDITLEELQECAISAFGGYFEAPPTLE